MANGIPRGVDPALDVYRDVQALKEMRRPNERQITVLYRTIQDYIRSHPDSFAEISNAMKTTSQLFEDMARSRKNPQQSAKYQKWSDHLMRQALSRAGQTTSGSDKTDLVGKWILSKAGQQPQAQQSFDPTIHRRIATGPMMIWTSSMEDRPEREVDYQEMVIDQRPTASEFAGFSSADEVDSEFRVEEWEQEILNDYAEEVDEERIEEDRTYRLNVEKDEVATPLNPGYRPPKRRCEWKWDSEDEAEFRKKLY